MVACDALGDGWIRGCNPRLRPCHRRLCLSHYVEMSSDTGFSLDMARYIATGKCPRETVAEV